MAVRLQKIDKGDEILRVTTKDIASLLDQPQRLLAELARYVAAGKAHSAGRVNYSRCTDKANVGGLQLASGAFFYDDNTCVVVTPKVP